MGGQVCEFAARLDGDLLTLSTLGKIFSRQHFEIFSYFSQQNRMPFFGKLSLMENIFMKCQILFSGKITN